ncbi:hypothetical protein CDAR_4861 [Caerostris darwini]|uniref:Uncharacterized protein n=1 Tax=Caerostris darwini TaxID=1538125 RepID=A0AAV4P587_9ARAC|nr:hypothetical protein CDAR_4861 [Caerostris darwini]
MLNISTQPSAWRQGRREISKLQSGQKRSSLKDRGGDRGVVSGHRNPSPPPLTPLLTTVHLLLPLLLRNWPFCHAWPRTLHPQGLPRDKRIKR